MKVRRKPARAAILSGYKRDHLLNLPVDVHPSTALFTLLFTFFVPAAGCMAYELVRRKPFLTDNRGPAEGPRRSVDCAAGHNRSKNWRWLRLFKTPRAQQRMTEPLSAERAVKFPRRLLHANGECSAMCLFISSSDLTRAKVYMTLTGYFGNRVSEHSVTRRRLRAQRSPDALLVRFRGRPPRKEVHVVRLEYAARV